MGYLSSVRQFLRSMQFTIRTQNPLEFFAKHLNLAPIPLVHTHLYSYFAKIVYDATEAGVFEAIGRQSHTSEQVAERCGLHTDATRSLLTFLTAAGYLRYRNERFSATRLTRKWLLKDSPTTMYYHLLFMRSIWDQLDHLSDYLKTGKGVDFHENLDEAGWNRYQQAMENVAGGGVKEIARKTPFPPHPTRMLDIGGSHGLYSVEFCKRHPTLQATILDLPEGIEKAAPLLQKYNLGNRVRHQAGNALTDDLGEAVYDLIFIASLTHHFTPEQNVALAKRAYRALKKGGFYVIQDFIRPEIAENADIAGSILNIYFALNSTAGVYSIDETKTWQREAGFTHHKVNRFITAPVDVQVIGRK